MAVYQNEITSPVVIMVSEINIFQTGRLPTGLIYRRVFLRPFTLYRSGGGGFRALGGAAATMTRVFTLAKNTIAFGAITINANGNTGVASTPWDDVTFDIDSVFTITDSGSLIDATLADVSFNFAGGRPA